jgi:hypothetical protein
MSTGYIYNGFGQYEKNAAGEKGITLMYAGNQFWLPYKKVTPLPDFTLREVDHDKSTPPAGEEGFLVYKEVRVSGQRLLEEMTETQIPVKNREKGIIPVLVHPDKFTGHVVHVYVGSSETGQLMFDDVRELKASEEEIASAELLASEYKATRVQEYFHSKRERIGGGKGQLFPTGLVKTFMAELGVEDIDAVVMKPQQQAPTAGLTIQDVMALFKELQATSQPQNSGLTATDVAAIVKQLMAQGSVDPVPVGTVPTGTVSIKQPPKAKPGTETGI